MGNMTAAYTLSLLRLGRKPSGDGSRRSRPRMTESYEASPLLRRMYVVEKRTSRHDPTLLIQVTELGAYA